MVRGKEMYDALFEAIEEGDIESYNKHREVLITKKAFFDQYLDDLKETDFDALIKNLDENNYQAYRQLLVDLKTNNPSDYDGFCKEIKGFDEDDDITIGLEKVLTCSVETYLRATGKRIEDYALQGVIVTKNTDKDIGEPFDLNENKDYMSQDKLRNIEVIMDYNGDYGTALIPTKRIDKERPLSKIEQFLSQI